MLIKNSFIIFLILIFNSTQAETYKFKNKEANIELLINNNELNLIKFEYELDQINDIGGSLELSDNEAKFLLKSKNLEYSLLNSFFPKGSKKTNKKIIISWFIENLIISKNYQLKNVNINLIYKEKFEELAIFDELRELEFFIYPNLEGPSNVYGYSINAGEILAARKISNDISGGSMFIKGKYSSSKEHSSILRIKDFRLKDDTKFENLIKSTRFFDIVSLINDTQKSFSYMEAPIAKENDLIYVKDAFIIGGLVGFTFSGEVNPIKKTSSFDGFYGPLYLFDKYIDRIPLFNKILTNNKNESLLGANFSVNKVDGETSVTINPLSLVTPGKTKRIFKIFDFLKKDKEPNQE